MKENHYYKLGPNFEEGQDVTKMDKNYLLNAFRKWSERGQNKNEANAELIDHNLKVLGDEIANRKLN